jgi:argininosuccinate lyase
VSAKTEHQLWGGRFEQGLEDAADRLNRSLSVDHRLWPQDVRAARAWVLALGRAGVLEPEEEVQLVAGLERVGERLADGAAAGAPDEDVHTLVERLLYEEVGELAGKLNTGRSRNDQVATDLRLWTLEAIAEIDREVAALGGALVEQARNGIDLLLPGYTHGQRAQPVRWAYVLVAHAWPLTRDRERLADAAGRTAELPLGLGAVAGSGMAVDRGLLQRLLGFDRLSPNALDATGDRDFVAETMFALTLLATHCSRLAGELQTYASSEYGFVRLADGYSTGSSLLPQKRNPDVLELARAKAARLLGDLSALLALLKGLPAGYSKDLQEDKALLFDAVDTLLLTLPALRGAVETLKPVAQRMEQALDASLRATDLADKLVEAGVPFREAHALIGRLVWEAEAAGVEIGEVPAEVAQGIHPRLAGFLAALGSWEDSVEQRATAGGSARHAVIAQIAELDAAFQLV